VSSGNLVVTNFGYGNSLFTGGIAADPLSSQAIASGNQANVVAAQISFYGNIESRGNLVISPLGEFVEPLSDSGVLAGDSLASQAIGGGMDTVFRSTGYQTTVNLSTHGNLILSGGVYVEYQSSGNLVITGTTEQNNTVSKNTAGNLVVAGSTTIDSAFAAESSGNLVILGNSEFNRVATILSSGNLLINGSSSGQTYNVSSAGNLIATGLSVVTNTVNIETSGNLVANGVSGESVTSARASLGNLIVQGSATYQIVQLVESDGLLTVVGTDEHSTTTITTSSGNLVVTGASTSEFVPAGSIESSGNLVVTGTTSVVFVPGAQPVKQSRGGGSYVFASSWDILKPYFPDDRHILGYVRGESDGIRRRKISGSTTFTVIRGLNKPTALSKNYDFLRSLPKVVVESSQSLSEESHNESVLTQILYEDQLLLDNQWGEFDLINDELNYETK
jgi:ribosomal protein S11